MNLEKRRLEANLLDNKTGLIENDELMKNKTIPFSSQKHRFYIGLYEYFTYYMQDYNKFVRALEKGEPLPSMWMTENNYENFMEYT